MLKINSLFVILLVALISCTKTPVQNNQGSKIRLSDDSLLTLIQYNTFQYFWEGAEPFSGMARERIHIDGEYPENDQNVITTGGGGFGLMAIIVGIDRQFISRKQGLERIKRITGFLAKADRFHGAWPHWLYGETGKTKPFSPKDNGGDLVETAYLVQGLIAVRQYLNINDPFEKSLKMQIDSLWHGVDWNWYQNGREVLYWHWSPDFGWEMNFPIEGYNECLITYIIAASSPTHSINANVYHKGWARNGQIVKPVAKYGKVLDLQHNYALEYGGPLFWSHYSFLGLNPIGLKDAYTNYGEHNKNHVLIDYFYCKENPKNFKGYSDSCWGLTASYSPGGYVAHKPGDEDLGVISPTGALASFPYTPAESMKAARYFYENLSDNIWGKYGFYDAFSLQENWFPQRYLAIDQGSIVIMIENYRTGLIWNLFMSATEVQSGLKKLGFNVAEPQN